MQEKNNPTKQSYFKCTLTQNIIQAFEALQQNPYEGGNTLATLTQKESLYDQFVCAWRNLHVQFVRTAVFCLHMLFFGIV